MKSTRTMVKAVAAGLFLLIGTRVNGEYLNLLGTRLDESAQTVGNNSSYDLTNDSSVTDANNSDDVRVTNFEKERKPLYQARIIPTMENDRLEKLHVYVAFEGALYGGKYTHLEEVPQDFPENKRFRVQKSAIRNDLVMRNMLSEPLATEWKNHTGEFLPITLKSSGEETDINKSNFVEWSTMVLMDYANKDEKLNENPELELDCASQYEVSYTLVRNGDHFVFIDEDHTDENLKIEEYNYEFTKNDWHFEENNYYEQTNKSWSFDLDLNLDFSNNNSQNSSSMYFSSYNKDFQFNFEGNFQMATVFPVFLPLLPPPPPVFFAPPVLFL